MIKIQKFKFGNRFESLETKNLSVAKQALTSYRYCSGNLYMSTKYAGEYAIVEWLDIYGDVVKYI